MSIATSLAALRRDGAAVPHKNPSIQLTQLPQSTSLSERAASARNALTLLSTADKTLPSFEKSLFLTHSSFDPATLSSDSHARLREAVKRLALRLTPVFLTRPCNAVLEWILQTLQLPLLGSSEEIDALMLCAIPYFETEQFSAVARICLPSDQAKKWRWLVKRIKVGRLVDTNFVVQNASVQVLKDLIARAVQCVKEGVAVTPLASVIANVVARRMASDDRPVLALVCIQALVQMPKAVNGKSAQHLVCALCTALGVAASHDLDRPVAEALASAAALLFSKSDAHSETLNTAIALLALCLRRNENSLSAKDAKMLLRENKLPTALPCLGPNESVDAYRRIITCAIASSSPSQKLLKLVGKALEAEELLTVESTSKLVQATLDACSLVTKDEQDTFAEERTQRLTALLTALFKGDFSEAVDDVLHDHFSKRNVKKKHKKRFQIVDAAVSRALNEIIANEAKQDGTPYPLSVDVLCLSHPEKSRRRKALTSIAARKLFSENAKETELRRLVTRLQTFISSEHDVDTVAIALEIVNRIPLHMISLDIVREALRRCTKGGAPKSKRSTDPTKLASALIDLGGRFAEENSALTSAVLLVLSLEGLLEKCSEADDGCDRIKQGMEGCKVFKLENYISEPDSTVLTKFVTQSIEDLILEDSDDFREMFAAISYLQESRLGELSRMWLQRLWAKVPEAERQQDLQFVSRRIRSLGTLHAKASDELMLEVRENLKSVLGTPQFPNHENAVFIWTVAAELRSWKHQEEIVSALIAVVGLQKAIDIIGAECVDESKSIVARKRSIEWYLNFCVVHPDQEVGKKAVIIASRLAYGDNAQIRACLKDIWSRRSASNRKKREKHSIVWDFLEVLSNLPQRSANVRLVSKDVDYLCKELNTQLRSLTQGDNDPIPPLCETSHESQTNGMYEDLLATTLLDQDKIERANVFILRAIQGRSFSGKVDQEKLYALLESTLRRLGSSEDLDSLIEAVYRLVLLLLSSRKNGDLDFDFRSFANTVATCFANISSSTAQASETNLTPVLLCLMGSLVSSSMPQDCSERASLVEILLMHSTSPRSTGSFARRIVDQLTGTNISGDTLLIHAEKLVVQRDPKSRLSDPRVPADKITDSAGAVVGAIRAIRSWVSSNHDSNTVTVEWLLSALALFWKFMRIAHEGGNEILLNAEPHDPEILSAVLTTLATLHRGLAKRNIAKGRDAALQADFDSLISVAFASESIDVVSDPAMNEIRSAAHDLVEALVTSQESGARRVLPQLFQSQTFVSQTSLIIKVCERVMPTIANLEQELPEVAKFVADAAYNEIALPPRERRSQIMKTLITHRSQAMCAEAVTKECLRQIYERERKVSDASFAVKECSSFLQEAKLECDEDISCLIHMEQTVDCRISAVHFLNPSFIAKLGSCQDGGEMSKSTATSARLSELFVILLGFASAPEKTEAIHLLLTSIPLPTLQRCYDEALGTEELGLKITSLRFLAERIEGASLPLFPTWESISDDSAIDESLRRKIETSFLEVIGGRICVLANTNGTSAEEIRLREVAVDTLNSLVQRLGSASFSLIQDFASQIAPLSGEDSSIVQSLSKSGHHSQSLRGKVLECLAICTAKLGKHSLSFVPILLASSCSVLETFCGSDANLQSSSDQKSYNAAVFITAAAVSALTAILTSCPMFFGGQALRRLAVLSLRTNVEAPKDLLRGLAAPEVPVDVFVSVFGNFASTDDKYIAAAPVESLIVLMESVAGGIERMYKSEMKVHWRKVLNVLLRSVDCGRDITVFQDDDEDEAQVGAAPLPQHQNGSSSAMVVSEEQEGRFEKCEQLDDICGNVLVKMVLKLSEAEFEKVFEALMQWLDGGSLPEAVKIACEDGGAEVENNISRAVPFFAIMGKLLNTLKTIMMPYFVQLMGRLIGIISRKMPKDAELLTAEDGKEEGRGTKRRRTGGNDGDVSKILVEQQGLLRETCTKLVGSFFSLDTKEGLMNTRLVGELQEALLIAFDDLEGQSATVSKALQGLAKRIMVPGVSKDTKKNQDMLIGLVRDVLSRTSNAKAKLRAGALDTCREMAGAVGDEFLGTLAESMPILAEVIDDEESEVSKAAERYVVMLESMAGEPILQQLK